MVLGMDNDYTGPYISDGKIQKSVEFGDAKPRNRLDAYSRLHDSAYAKYEDYGHRRAADALYYEWTRNDGFLSQVAGDAVLFGNPVMNGFTRLYTAEGFISLVVKSIGMDLDLQDYMENEKKYKQELLEYFKSDPHYGDIDYDPFAKVTTTGAKAAPALLGVGGRRNASMGNSTSVRQGAGVDGTTTEPKQVYEPTFGRTEKAVQTANEMGIREMAYRPFFPTNYSLKYRYPWKRRKGRYRKNLIYVS